MSRHGYDYIIVGGGSAGCVLAARLSENPDVNVLLLEAGKADKHPYIHMPVGFAKMTSGKMLWGFNTTPQKHANNREIPYAQAKVLGGGSSINAEVFTRGHVSDYDRWAKEDGCTGWSFDEIKPYFIRSEGNDILSGDWHGVDGPLGVSNIANPQTVTEAFVKSCQENGMPYNPDFNGAEQKGAGVYQTTIKNAKRCSAAVGYLHPVLDRPNLKLHTNVSVLRVIFEGNRATGVECIIDNEKQIISATQEIILTAGAIGTPKLLMLSGVGPAEHLNDNNIDIVCDLQGVGQNLNDHFGVDIVAKLKANDGLDKYAKPHWAVWAGLQYILFKTGPVASNVVEGGAFWHSDITQEIADLQFHFLAGSGAEEGVRTLDSGSGVTLNSYTLRPKSRGSVKLRSADPFELPLVDPNYLADPDDLKVSAEGVKISQEIFNQHSLQKYIEKIHFPNDGVKTQADYEEFVRQFGRTSYHPVGTCKMGVDEMAVVDSQLKIHGLEGIRICDSSIMPSLIGSNTNAPTIMIAEKASDLILGKL